jgi:hypothetical protein
MVDLVLLQYFALLFAGVGKSFRPACVFFGGVLSSFYYPSSQIHEFNDEEYELNECHVSVAFSL